MHKSGRGDVLTIKSDVTGAIDRCIKSTVLKEAKERDFIGLLNLSAINISALGVYAEIKLMVLF